MELSGKIFKVNPLQTGEGKNGTWKKQEIVIETDSGKYPKKVCVSMWGDLVTNNSFEEGRDISIEFDIESREYNGRWYTDVKAWRINKNENAGNTTSATTSTNTTPAYTAADVPAAEIEDDLPF